MGEFWVPVSKGLPRFREWVWAFTTDEEFVVVCYIPEPEDEAKAKRDGHLSGITHWSTCKAPNHGL